jgi:YVTN family beta-propeller protein
LSHPLLVGIAFLAAGLGPVSGARVSGPQMAIEAVAGPYVYVANQSSASVSVIDVTTDQVVRTIDLTKLGFSENAKPHHVTVEPDGSAFYVSLIGDGFVLKLTPAGDLLGQAPFETPGMLALDPHSDQLWVGRSMMAVSPPQRIGRIDRSDMSIDEVDVFFDRPHALALSPDGRYVYTASLAGNDIAIIDPVDERIELLKVPGPTHVFVQFAVSPDGSRLVTGGEMSGKLLVFGLEDRLRPELIMEIDVNPMPWHPVFSPDGRRVYVGNRGANTVTVIRTSDWSVEAVVEDAAFAEPHGSALSPDGKKLYISNRNVKDPAAGDDRMDHGAMGHDEAASGDERTGRVTVIDTATLEVIETIDVGRYAAGMGTSVSGP